MATRVAINGFGRIGRAFFRIAWDDPEVEVVHINDLANDKMLAHLLVHDSVQGHWAHDVKVTDEGIVVDGCLIGTSVERDPTKLPWAAKKVDVVLEATGVFRSREGATKHVDAGAKKVLISAPAKGTPDATIVVGVNDEVLDVENDVIVSNASCTTNCLAPVAKVLDDTFGIEAGLMTTIHSYTMDQCLLDAPHAGGDFRRARAAALNMVPTTTGAAKAVALVLPQLEGKLDGMAMRVPTPNVSLVDLFVQTKEPVTAEAINAAIIEAAEGPLKGILVATDMPVVSGDLVGNPASSIFDLSWTKVMGTHAAKIMSWYDNEWGYANRLLDLARMVSGLERR
jgi:glyceraldehyde-3-phosphate dehydrogenase type I